MRAETLYVARSILYELPDPRSQIIFGKRHSDSNTYAGRWEFFGGKRDWTPLPSGHWEDSKSAAMRELWEEARIPAHLIGEIYDFCPDPNEYTLQDDPKSKYTDWKIHTDLVPYALYCKEYKNRIRITEEHEDFLWLTAEEAHAAFLLGMFDVQPQAACILPVLAELSKLSQNAGKPIWKPISTVR